MNIEGNIARTTVSDAVYRRLRDQILSAGTAPGEPLPSERTLSETFGVNRHAVREAIKRLQQAGLVTVVHGGATRVTDWRLQGGPELLGAVASSTSEQQRERLAEQTLAARSAIAMTLLKAAAAAGPVDVDAEIRALLGAADGGELVAYRSLWRVIATASDNLAAQLTLNSLDAALDALGADGETALRGEAERRDAISSLGSALASGNVDAAVSAANDLLGSSNVAA